MNCDECCLVPLAEKHFDKLYDWYISEKQMERYSCRPIASQLSAVEYADRMKSMLCNPYEACFVLITADDYSEPLGRIRLFDYNPRNHSAEFGYYLPEQNRNKGLGSIMLRQFIEMSFVNEKHDLNKLYATTSSNNIASIKLLEKHGFKVDGRQREHYWIDGNRYDQIIYSILRSEWCLIINRYNTGASGT